MNAHACHAEAELFGHVLSCEILLPADFTPGAGRARPEHALALLRSLAVIEDMGMMEQGQHESDELPPFGARMEAKLDLGLLLLGRILEQTRPALPERRVRWSIRGARLQCPAPAPLPAMTEGLLRLQLCDWLPEPLELPACVLGGDTDHLWLQFPAFPCGLHDALERHLFRQHRRQIAQARNNKPS